MSHQDIQDLLNRYQSGTASADEKLQVELWYHQQAGTSDWSVKEDQKQLIFEKLKKAIDVEIGRPVKKLKWYRYAAAASVLLAVSFSLYLIRRPQSGSQIVVHRVHKNDVNPGGNKAVLTLADGRQVILDQTQNGLVASQGESRINKTADGSLIYNDQGQNGEVSMMNKLSIPRGGQYQVVLPDGTRVWLNSSTTLTYPTAFTGRERRVELTGEAYFEVTHNADQPFVVKTIKQEIKVLGTHFNVNAYEDDQQIKTTLMEGSVQINCQNKNYLLKPGEQALTGADVQISSVDTESAIDWKNGIFDLNNESLPNLMKKISRWYNVDVIYTGNVPKTGFGGEVSRAKKLSDVLNVLETTSGAVHFKIEGRRVTVMQ